MLDNYKNAEDYHNRIYLLFNGFIAVSLLPFGYLLLQQTALPAAPTLTGAAYWLVLAALMPAGALLIYAGRRQFNHRLRQCSKLPQLRDKLNHYMRISIRKYAYALLSGLVYVVGLFITQSPLFILAYVIALILWSIKRPTLEVIAKDLKLSKQDRQIIIQKKEINR